MPYKFEYEKIKLPEGKDRRCKLTTEQRLEIFELYATGNYSQRQLAKEYDVSRRLIQFIIDPGKKKRDLELREMRGGSMAYYDKDKQREYTKNHRRYKQKILKEEGVI